MTFSYKMLRVLVGVGLASLLLPASARTGDKKVEDLLARMRTAYSAIKSANYTTECLQGGQTFISKYTYTSPANVKVTITSPTDKKLGAGVIVTTDGQMIRIMTPTAPKELKEKFSPDLFDSNLVGNLESLCFWDYKRQLSTAKGMNMEHSVFKLEVGTIWHGKKWTVLQETAATQRIICSYYVDPSTNLICRTLVKPMAAGNPTSHSDSWLVELNGKPIIKDAGVNVIHV